MYLLNTAAKYKWLNEEYEILNGLLMKIVPPWSNDLALNIDLKIRKSIFLNIINEY